MYKLLIAEDELSNRKWLTKAIDWGGIGFEVIAIVESGDRAWEIMQQQQDIDVIMTDIRMPNIWTVWN
jgi:two-component system response regulator YesN